MSVVDHGSKEGQQFALQYMKRARYTNKLMYGFVSLPLLYLPYYFYYNYPLLWKDYRDPYALDNRPKRRRPSSEGDAADVDANPTNAGPADAGAAQAGPRPLWLHSGKAKGAWVSSSATPPTGADSASKS